MHGPGLHTIWYIDLGFLKSRDHAVHLGSIGAVRDRATGKSKDLCKKTFGGELELEVSFLHCKMFSSRNSQAGFLKNTVCGIH